MCNVYCVYSECAIRNFYLVYSKWLICNVTCVYIRCAMCKIYCVFSDCAMCNVYCVYEALQDIVYIRLPPGINFGISLKGQKSLRWGVFGLPLTHRVKILQKNRVWNLTHHASHITYHILHRNL